MTMFAVKVPPGVVAYLLLVGSHTTCAQGTRTPPPAVRFDAVTAIIEVLKTHQVVALGDWHYNLQLHELRLELIRDPRFPDAVNDIVVEFGTPKHQGVIERYVNGFDVARDELRRVWAETSMGSVWDGAVYEEFYQAVREVNANLPEHRRIRVVLGDPTPLTMEAEAAQIKRAVIDKGRNALIVFGAMHLPRKPLFYPVSDPQFAQDVYEDPESVSTTAHLESAGISVFSIWPKAIDEFVEVQPEIESWAMPALSVVSGTTLGLAPFARFANTDTVLSVPNADGEGTHLEHVSPDPARSGLMQEQFDAVLLLGPQDGLRKGRPYDSAQTN
jgi:hypothetical protein